MKRSEVKEEYKWKTDDLFASDEEWEKGFDEAAGYLDFSAYSGKLGERETLLKLLKAMDEAAKKIERLGLYAHMRHDEDATVSKYTSFALKMGGLYTKFSIATDFFEPELSAQSNEYLQSLIDDKEFSDYDYMLKRIKDGKAHVLSKQEERLIGMAGEIFGNFRETFAMINNADINFDDIEWEGKKTKLSHGLYGMILHSSNREKRKEAYEKYYSGFLSLINTITSTYYGNVKKDVFLSRAYKFNSCLERALFSEDVERAVYDNLLKSVNANLKSMHRYIADRKKILGYDKQYFYDIYAPLVEGVEFKLSYEDAYNYVVEGLAPLGKDYQNLLRRGFNERWLDVEETEGKCSGAYSTGCFGCHPFVLLNYQPTLHDVFTIAHEMGHSLHTYFSHKNQPYAKCDYKIFVAEVASTVNEVLLLKFMLSKAEDDNLKKYLLNYYLDTMRGTLHRQTMFAEFEYEAHAMVERDEPLTKENLCNLYAELGKKYYGSEVEHDYNISCEWSRIPHFYNAFYVYKYSTGIISAINIANNILTQKEGAKENYFKFLSGGSSTDPVSLLKLAGVDLTTATPFDYAMKEFDETLREFEKLMGI